MKLMKTAFSLKGFLKLDSERQLDDLGTEPELYVRTTTNKHDQNEASAVACYERGELLAEQKSAIKNSSAIRI
jgi:hypothetical protein